MLLRYALLCLLLLYLTYGSLDYQPFRSDEGMNVFVYRKEHNMIGTIVATTLPVGATISHCNVAKRMEIIQNNDRKLPFRIGTGFIGKGRKFLNWSRCLTKNNIWNYETSHLNCPTFQTFVNLGQIFDLRDEEIIFISCKHQNEEHIQELFIEEYPKIQVFQLYSNLQRSMSKLPKIYISHGSKIHCVSNFPGLTNIVWKKTFENKQPDFSKGQFLVVEVNMNDSLSGQELIENEYECSLEYTVNERKMDISSKFIFFLQILYEVKVIDQFGVSERSEFDVGETLRCSSKKLNTEPYFIWDDPIVMVGLVDNLQPSSFIQSPSESLTIATLSSRKPPNNLVIECFLQGSSTKIFKIFKTEAIILTSSITTYVFNSNKESPLERFKDMKCKDKGSSIYLFSNPDYTLPLSRLMKVSKFVSLTNNKTVSLPPSFSNSERYFVACTAKGYIQTPVELEVGKSNLVRINYIYPNFKNTPDKQTKGFIFECRTDGAGFTAEWKCPSCTLMQQQRVEVKSDQSKYLHIISNTDIRIVYHCIVFKQSVKFMKKKLVLDIYGDMTEMIKVPKFFFSVGDPVICVARKLSSDNFHPIELVLPTRLMYSSPRNEKEIFQKSTASNIDSTNEKLWTPRIPDYSDLDYKSQIWNFQACCLEYRDKNSLQCGVLHAIKVAVNYTFKYNYDIPTVVIYPGNILKCCMIWKYSTDLNKAERTDTQNCLAAMIIFYANQDPGANPDNPGIALLEGTQVVVPISFAGKDISRAATFVKCHTENSIRKEFDLKRSATRLYIKSCTLSPPPLIMLPSDQTMFLVNNTIFCVPNSEECKSSLLFDFIILRGGILVDIIRKTVSIVLVDKYLGNNIRVTCESGNSKASKDISVERVPYAIRIEGLQKIMGINSVITCNSDGFPEPSIVWTQLNGSSLLLAEDYAIIIRNWDRSGRYEFICTAFNKHGETSKRIEFQIFNVNMKDVYFSKDFYVIIYLLLFLYHVLLVFIVYFLFKDYIHSNRYVLNKHLTTLPNKGGK